ncbi:hypothetical protein [Burkholderia anthina]|uniref:hypothetical protein n=1 Tax=Burkholderia anthina TaxID=179879 RepID=UPI00158926BE|nr:hypothetical protein [Burkholderia anthina]
MKRMLLAALVLASMVGVARAQTQTFHFGEGQVRPAGSPAARPAPPRRHVTPPHHRRAVHKRRPVRRGKPARSGIYTHA